MGEIPLAEMPAWTAWKAFLNGLVDDRVSEVLLEGLLDAGVDPTERNVKRLFWRDNMEGYTTNKWTSDLLGTVPAYINTVQAFEGDYVLRVTNPLGNESRVRTVFEPARPQKIGVEIRWLKDANLEELAVDLANMDRFASIHYAPANKEWGLVDSAGAVVSIANSDEEIVDGCWCYLYFVVDFASNVYKKLQTNFLDIDLNIPITQVFPFLGLIIRLSARMWAAGSPIYYDDVRLYTGVV